MRCYQQECPRLIQFMVAIDLPVSIALPVSELPLVTTKRRVFMETACEEKFPCNVYDFNGAGILSVKVCCVSTKKLIGLLGLVDHTL